MQASVYIFRAFSEALQAQPLHSGCVAFVLQWRPARSDKPDLKGARKVWQVCRRAIFANMSLLPAPETGPNLPRCNNSSSRGCRLREVQCL